MILFLGRISLGGVVGNQTRGPIATKVISSQLNQDEDPIFELHQLHEVDKEPGKPSQKAGELQSAPIGDCRCSADYRHVTAISVTKGGWSSCRGSALN